MCCCLGVVAATVVVVDVWRCRCCDVGVGMGVVAVIQMEYTWVSVVVAHDGREDWSHAIGVARRLAQAVAWLMRTTSGHSATGASHLKLWNMRRKASGVHHMAQGSWMMLVALAMGAG